MKVQIEDSTLSKIISDTVKATVKELGIQNESANSEMDLQKPEKSDEFLKTQQLFENYNGFKRLLEIKKQEILEYQQYGVPNKTNPFDYNPHSNTVQGIVLPEETVEAAVRTVQRSVETIVQAIRMVETGLESIKGEMYYEIIPMFYLDGMTMEDIGKAIGKDAATVSRNRVKLLEKASIAMFPETVIAGMM